MKTLTLVALSLACSLAVASEHYKCVVKTATLLSDSGDLRVTELTKVYVGEEFVVDRETGRMIGLVTNHNASGKPTVLDLGGGDQAYKVLTIYKPKVFVDLLLVQDFVDGTTKPFLFISGPQVITGTCSARL